MARSPHLKVFRTPIGFDDAYVAAPSRKAALEAWGSDKDLFASGAAERIDDPDLIRQPLARPGTVIRKPRGSLADHLAALPKVEPATRPETIGLKKKLQAIRRAVSEREATAEPKPPEKASTKPDRMALDRAEANLANAEARHGRERLDLQQRQVALDREHQKLEAGQARERNVLTRQLNKARERYEAALRKSHSA